MDVVVRLRREFSVQREPNPVVRSVIDGGAGVLANHLTSDYLEYKVENPTFIR